MRKRYFYEIVFLVLILSGRACMNFLHAMPSAQQLPQVESEPVEADVAEEAEEQATEHGAEGEVEGPETVDLSEDEIGQQGNWVKKKEWLLKSYELRNQVNALIVEIQRARRMFDDKYEQFDKELERFYKELGLDQGKLEELFNGLLKYLEKRKKQAHTLLTTPESEEDKGRDQETLAKLELLEEQVKNYKTQFEQLKLDMQAIEDLDKSLAQRLKKVDEHIAIAVKESSNAETIIQSLWKIIDHNKARIRYYQLKGTVLEQLQSVARYLKETLYADFERTGQTIKTQIQKTQSGIKILEEKGFIIKNRAQRVEALKLKELQAEAMAAKQAQEQEKEKEVALATKKPTPKKKPWYQRWYDVCVESVAQVINFFQTTFAQLFGLSVVPSKKEFISTSSEEKKLPAAVQQEQPTVQPFKPKLPPGLLIR